MSAWYLTVCIISYCLHGDLLFAALPTTVDHQLIFCKRNITRIKRYDRKQTKFCSFKNYAIMVMKKCVE